MFFLETSYFYTRAEFYLCILFALSANSKILLFAQIAKIVNFGRGGKEKFCYLHDFAGL